MTKKNSEMSQGCFTSFMVFFLVVSIALIYWSYRKYSFTRNVLDQENLVTGVVIDMNLQERNPSNNRRSGMNKVAPVLEFVFQQDTFRYYSEQYSDISSYAIGDQVQIYVNAERPMDSVIDTWSEKWGGATFVGILGGIFLFLSLGSLSGRWSS